MIAVIYRESANAVHGNAFLIGRKTMQESRKIDDQARTDELDELDPMILGEVTEITGSGSGGNGDESIVWGTRVP